MERRAAAAGHRRRRPPAGSALVRRFPRGPVLGISPFNFPLNLVAHKLAPAIAVGAPIVLKPAPATPLSALLLGELLAETDLPAGGSSVLPVPNDRAPALVADPRLPVVSFTGSARSGARIQDAVPHKHVTLELGGNAAAVVLADWSSDADLDWAAARIATFAQLPGRASPASRCSGCSSTRRVDRLRAAAGRRGRGAGHRRPGRRGDRRRAADRRGVRARGSRSGSTRRCAAGARVLTGGAPGRRDVRADRARRRAGRRAAWCARRCSARCWWWRAVDGVDDGLRRGQRLPVRAAGRRVHPRPADRVPGAPRARGRRRHHRRRAVLPRRPDALRRGEGVRRRPRGRARRDGGPTPTSASWSHRRLDL